MAGHIPTVKTRRLTAELRRIRENSAQQWTLDQVGEALGWHGAKVHRIEHDKSSVLVRDVRRLLDLYGVEDPQREALLTLAEEARRTKKEQGWWQRHGDALPRRFQFYVGLETEATVLRNYESELVPGLLQTEDYARALMRVAAVPEPDEEIERRVAARMARQQRLAGEDPPEYWVVLNEAVIRRVVGDRKTMREQLHRLAEAARHPTTVLQMLPYDAGAHPAMYGPFHIFSFPDGTGPDVGYVEYGTGSLYLEKQEEVRTCRLMFEHLKVRALGPERSVELIEGAAGALM